MRLLVCGDGMYWKLVLRFPFSKVIASRTLGRGRLKNNNIIANLDNHYLCGCLPISFVCRSLPVIVISTHFDGKPLTLLPFEVTCCGYESRVLIDFEKATVVSRCDSVLHRTKVTRVSVCSLQ